MTNDKNTLTSASITRHSDGSATARYRWSHLAGEGSLHYADEDVSDFTDDDLLGLFAELCDWPDEAIEGDLVTFESD